MGIFSQCNPPFQTPAYGPAGLSEGPPEVIVIDADYSYGAARTEGQRLDARSLAQPTKTCASQTLAVAVDFGVSAHFRLSKQLVIISRRVSRFIFAKFREVPSA